MTKAPSPTGDRLPISTKLTYGLGTTLDMWGNWLYPSIVWVVFNMYLQVPAWQVSLALGLRLIFDALSDPLFGWLSDNARTRWGRRRPFMFVGAIASGICLPLLFVVPEGWGSSDVFGYEISAYFWWMIGSSAVYMTIVSCFNMPYQSLGFELTPDYNERTSLFSYKTGMQKIPEIALFSAAMFITRDWFKDPETGVTNNLQGAFFYACILGAIMAIVGAFVAIKIKEPYYGRVVDSKQKKIPITDTLTKTFGCRPFRAQLAMALSYNIGTSMVGTLGFYATVYWVCSGDKALGSEWNFVMGLTNFFIGFCGVPTFAYLSRRLGKRHCMYVVQGLAATIFFATWWLYTPEIKWLQVVASGFIAFTGAGFWMLYGAMGADVVDQDELTTGVRREGAFQAGASWILKFGNVLGTVATGIVLTSTGFDEKLAIQSDETLFNIRLYLAAIPIAGLTLAAFALSRYGLSRANVADIRKQLEERRGKV